MLLSDAVSGSFKNGGHVALCLSARFFAAADLLGVGYDVVMTSGGPLVAPDVVLIRPEVSVKNQKWLR